MTSRSGIGTFLIGKHGEVGLKGATRQQNTCISHIQNHSKYPPHPTYTRSIGPHFSRPIGPHFSRPIGPHFSRLSGPHCTRPIELRTTLGDSGHLKQESIETEFKTDTCGTCTCHARHLGASMHQIFIDQHQHELTRTPPATHGGSVQIQADSNKTKRNNSKRNETKRIETKQNPSVLLST